MCPQLDLLLSKTFFGWLLDIILCLIGAGYPVDTLICHLPFPSFGGLSKIMYCLLFSAVTLHLAATETWKSISVKESESILRPNRSDTVLHDALHAVRAGDPVSLSEGRVPGNHQVGLPWDQNGAPWGIHGCLPQCGGQDKRRGPAAHPGRAETLGTAV